VQRKVIEGDQVTVKYSNIPDDILPSALAQDGPGASSHTDLRPTGKRPDRVSVTGEGARRLQAWPEDRISAFEIDWSL